MKTGHTVLMLAAMNGDSEIVDLLLFYKANVNITQACLIIGEAATEELLNSYEKTIAKLKANHPTTPNQPDESALTLAAKNGQEDIIQKLIAARADCRHRGKQGFNALGCYVYHSRNSQHPPLSEAVVRLFMQQPGVSIDDFQGLKSTGLATLVFFACQEGDVATLELLIRLGADVNKARIQRTDPFPITPLLIAVTKGETAITQHLLDCDRLDTARDKLIQCYLLAHNNGNTAICELLAKKMYAVHNTLLRSIALETEQSAPCSKPAESLHGDEPESDSWENNEKSYSR